MSLDTPAKIAILGAGPIGIECALYARFLGYDVEVFERGEVAEHPYRGWGSVRMFTPFRMNRSSLGLAALRAQRADYEPPDDGESLTGREWAERYLRPLAETDLLAGHIHTRTEVVSVGKESSLKTESPGQESRGDEGFRILVRDSHGNEQVVEADAVVDSTGVFGQPNWIGAAGIPAVGEIALRDRIEFRLPDLAGADRERFAGRRILVIGAGYSAATNIVSLAELAREAPETHITWITRRDPADISTRPAAERSERDNKDGDGSDQRLDDNGDNHRSDQATGAGSPSFVDPIARIPHDRLEQRDQLARRANKLAASGSDHVTYWPGTVVERIARGESTPDGGPFRVTLTGRHAGDFDFDVIAANVGGKPNLEMTRELQVHHCYATEGPMKLAAALLGSASNDCLQQAAPGPSSLVNPEMDFYVLGAKSYGRNSQFLFEHGLRQIRDLFTILGDRETLDLYAGAETLPR